MNVILVFHHLNKYMYDTLLYSLRHILYNGWHVLFSGGDKILSQNSSVTRYHALPQDQLYQFQANDEFVRGQNMK